VIYKTILPKEDEYMTKPTCYSYGEKEINHLKRKDKKLGAAIDKIGMIPRNTNPDLFAALVNSIVGQQISQKALNTVWERMVKGLGEITPQTILACDEKKLQSFGMTFKKVSYIHGVARRVHEGELDIYGLHSKSDEEVCKELIKIPGIGLWTAEMLMLFSMERPNILSYGDLAIIRGIKMLYGHKEVSKECFEKYRKRYSPYGSVASLYLWAIAGGALEE